MERRRALSLVAASAALGAGEAIEPALAQEMPGHGQASDGRARRQTGRVDLIIAGQRTGPPKTGADILKAARGAQFVEGGRHKMAVDGGGVDFVPATFPQNAIAEGIIQGFLVHKFVISGKPPAQWAFLGVGTFYLHVDFVEAPGYEEGRWIGRIVDDAGKVRHIIVGVEVRHVIDLHVDEQRKREHSMPSVSTHSIASADVERQLIDGPFPVAAWTTTVGDWASLGSGCSRVVVCNPPV